MDFVAATETGQMNLSLGQRMDLPRATPVGGRFGPSLICEGDYIGAC